MFSDSAQTPLSVTLIPLRLGLVGPAILSQIVEARRHEPVCNDNSSWYYRTSARTLSQEASASGSHDPFSRRLLRKGREAYLRLCRNRHQSTQDLFYLLGTHPPLRCWIWRHAQRYARVWMNSKAHARVTRCAARPIRTPRNRALARNPMCPTRIPRPDRGKGWPVYQYSWRFSSICLLRNPNWDLRNQWSNAFARYVEPIHWQAEACRKCDKTYQGPHQDFCLPSRHYLGNRSPPIPQTILWISRSPFWACDGPLNTLLLLSTTFCFLVVISLSPHLDAVSFVSLSWAT